ncbi:MAG: Ppx/GppA phosphatase family protein [Steroidobacteraceae bacterium]
MAGTADRSAAGRRPEVVAAVDLGSNSFRMVVARHVDGRLVVVDRLREMVRLAAGLRRDGRLDPAYVARALACLGRFGQRLREIRADRVRVVGTNTLRKAHHKQAFLERARLCLGHPIEIISGIEEARLIYAGVTQSLAPCAGRRLVVDIGGGSTELIIGRGTVPQAMESLYIGCVAISREYFPGGRFSGRRLEAARLAAGIEFETIASRYRRVGWSQAVGSSGSFKAILEAIRGLCPAETMITRRGLDRLIRHLERAGSVARAELEGVTAERAPVFAGGVAIASQLFESLRISSMQVAEGALREGVLQDLIGRRTHRDVREATVSGLQRRYGVDVAQARQVERTAVALLRRMQADRDATATDECTVLGWAARLHEIGLEVSHAQYHRHGAYLLEHSDLPGFSREDQRLLALLVGSHRRRLHIEGVAGLVPPWDRRAPRLIVALRLAVLLHRARTRGPVPAPRLVLRGRRLKLVFPAGWLRRHPLTRADLEQEADHLRALRWTLDWR